MRKVLSSYLHKFQKFSKFLAKFQVESFSLLETQTIFHKQTPRAQRKGTKSQKKSIWRIDKSQNEKNVQYLKHISK